MELLRPDEIERIERDHAAGLPARVIVDAFASKGAKMTEATFRKYVQAGLLPRSRRVGKKGKHQGSQGLYPVSSLRRMNAIRQMMAEGLTLEDIKASFVVFRNHLDSAGTELAQVFDGYERQVEKNSNKDLNKKELTTRLRALRVQAKELLHEISKFGSAVTSRADSEASSL